MRLIRANVRTPDEIEGDILSYVTANEFSGGRLNAMLDEFGLTDLDALADGVSLEMFAAWPNEQRDAKSAFTMCAQWVRELIPAEADVRRPVLYDQEA